MPPERRNIMVVAGEASGDMHAASLIEALRRLDPALEFYGLGGPRLREAGVKLLADSADMAVVGLTEVFLKLPLIMKVMGRLKRSLVSEKPLAVILVDYPDFNLRLAEAAHKQGIKVFYYISPQVWAWRPGRIKKIRRVVDRMAVILPFETPFYHQAGVDALFVGHPLLDIVPEHHSRKEARRRLGLREDISTVAIFPGSRPAEVSRLLPIFLEAALEIKTPGDRQFVLPLADTLSKEWVEKFIRRSPVEVVLVSQAAYDVLAASDAAMVASGTATLEAALLNTPMVIVYKVSRLSYLLGKRFIRVKNIGLVNIIAGKTIVPELIQSQAEPGRIAQAIEKLLEDSPVREEMMIELAKIRNKLGTRGVAERTAGFVLDLING